MVELQRHVAAVGLEVMSVAEQQHNHKSEKHRIGSAQGRSNQRSTATSLLLNRRQRARRTELQAVNGERLAPARDAPAVLTKMSRVIRSRLRAIDVFTCLPADVRAPKNLVSSTPSSEGLPEHNTQSGRAILLRMRNLPTSGGRLFIVTVEGPNVTLADTMVAAPRYLRTLETQFKGAADLLRCLRAYNTNLSRLPGDIADEQNDFIQRWIDAHHAATDDARRWLSDPTTLTFAVALASP